MASITERLSWIDVAGVEHKLDDILDGPAGHFLPILDDQGKGMVGRGMPPWTWIEQDVPLKPGARLRYTLAAPREVDVPLLVRGADEGDLRGQLRTLRGWLNPLAGPGRLRAYLADTSVRELVCNYLAGAEEDEGTQYRGPGWMEQPLVFRAVDPFWYDQTATVLSFSAATPPLFFAVPFIPLHLGASGVASAFGIVNMGDVEMWPIWTIHGPCTTLTLTNITTGLVLAAAIVLGATESLTVDTTPFVKTVVKQDGTNQYGTLSAASALWSLPVGNNSISLSLTGGGAASAITLAYKQRYLGV